MVVIDPRKLADFMRSPAGPVVRMLIEKGEVVKRGARRRVGVYKPPDAYSRAHRVRRPGTLRDEIVKRVVEIQGLPAVVVGVFNDPVAWWHHEGTPPHAITPVRAPRLVFFWKGAGHVVSLRRVQHPGTEPNPFLEDALADLRGAP